MNSTPQISVIVAFYNVEDCAAFCVESLLDQTYRDFELILVDDGSTDQTGLLLDRYADNPRVHVLHKKNGGLSDARNFGVAHSKGRYVTFVDGDDLVSPEYLSSLAAGMSGFSNRMVIGAIKYVRYDYALQGKVSWGMSYPSEECGREPVVHGILYEEVPLSACAKLAPREIYLSKLFPVGDYYEDLAIIADHLLSVESYALVTEPIYGYVLRQGSIVRQKSVPVKHVDDYTKALARAEAIFSELPFDIGESLTYQKCLRYSRIYSLLRAVSPRTEHVESLEREVLRWMKSSLNCVMRNSRAPLMSKFRFALLALSPNLYNVTFRVFKRIARGV